MKEHPYNSKITPEHLERKAVVYLRQSSEKQVRENKESQRLQYSLAERAREWGWRKVEVIDCDLGSSAAVAAARREGFERLIASVAMREVGILLSREASRLLRTGKDWCRLFEVCQVSGTLIVTVRPSTPWRRRPVGLIIFAMGGNSWRRNTKCLQVCRRLRANGGLRSGFGVRSSGTRKEAA